MDVDYVGVDVDTVNVEEHSYGLGQALGFQVMPDPFQVQYITIPVGSPFCQPPTSANTSGDGVSTVISSSSILSGMHEISLAQCMEHEGFPNHHLKARVFILTRSGKYEYPYLKVPARFQ